MMIRDAALTDKVPKLSRAEFEAFSGRLVYNMGHACFEFMEARYGKEGIRQFLYTLRKGILGGGLRGALQAGLPHDARGVRRRLRQVAEGALQAVPRPAAARRLRPRPLAERGEDELHPGLRLRALALGRDRGHRHRQPQRGRGRRRARLDEGRHGHQEPHRRLRHRVGEHHDQPRVHGRPLARASTRKGDHVGFFGRTGKGRSFFLLSVLDGGVKTQGARPARRGRRRRACSPTGGRSSSPRCKEGVSDIWKLDLDTGAVTNLTQDEFADNNPQVSPDGKLVVYERRISGHAKIYAFPLANPSQQDAAHLRAVRRPGAVLLERRHEGLLRLRRGRRHPEPAQPRPGDRRDRAVHRRLRRHDGAGAAHDARAATGSPSSRYYKGEYRLHTQRHRGAGEGGRAGRARRPPRGSSTSSPT